MLADLLDIQVLDDIDIQDGATINDFVKQHNIERFFLHGSKIDEDAKSEDDVDFLDLDELGIEEEAQEKELDEMCIKFVAR